jgi:cyclopropane-fatty-acyl-phospholipid synthase
MLLSAGERVAWPDPLLRAAVGVLVGRTRRRLRGDGSADAEREFARAMDAYPIATDTAAANAQHYELPAAFFGLMLGPRRKYSCCYYSEPGLSLAEAEFAALEETAAHATLADGQTILELGCGWGSLSLFMARRFPKARVVAVSNSASQRAFIVQRAARDGLRNLSVVTSDMNAFSPASRFDRVVSIEMFEHMSNWRTLLGRAVSWLEPQGRIFIHVFTNRDAPYRFDIANRADWIAQHFFTGGIMPSQGLIRQFSDLVVVDAEWRWSGRHYQRTAEHWLENFDANRERIAGLLDRCYGGEAALWLRRWRLFLHATAGLFGHANGNQWGVSHYLLRPAA